MKKLIAFIFLAVILFAACDDHRAPVELSKSVPQPGSDRPEDPEDLEDPEDPEGPEYTAPEKESPLEESDDTASEPVAEEEQNTEPAIPEEPGEQEEQTMQDLYVYMHNNVYANGEIILSDTYRINYSVYVTDDTMHDLYNDTETSLYGHDYYYYDGNDIYSIVNVRDGIFKFCRMYVNGEEIGDYHDREYNITSIDGRIMTDNNNVKRDILQELSDVRMVTKTGVILYQYDDTGFKVVYNGTMYELTGPDSHYMSIQSLVEYNGMLYANDGTVIDLETNYFTTGDNALRNLLMPGWTYSERQLIEMLQVKDDCIYFLHYNTGNIYKFDIAENTVTFVQRLYYADATDDEGTFYRDKLQINIIDNTIYYYDEVVKKLEL